MHSELPEISTLVIGGGGYIGSQLAPILESKGRRVTALGRSKVPKYSLPRNTRYISGDFGNHELISNLLNQHQEIIFLAYATVPNTSYEDPLLDILQNLPAAVRLFSEVAENRQKLILVSSGGTVYGEATQLPIKEDHPAKPISPYGVTKLTLENYARLYSITHGLNYICVRPSNVYGVGQRPFAGQGFISTAMASAMQGRVVRIFGLSGTIRDYIYITDLANGIADVLLYGKSLHTYNLGSGIGYSNQQAINEMIPLLREIGVSVNVEHLPERPFDVKANILDSSSARYDTGWVPQVNLTEGLRLTRDWLRFEAPNFV